MNEKNPPTQKDIVPYHKQELLLRSQALVRRGLESLSALHGTPTDRARLARVSNDQSRSRLPTLPPALKQRRLEVTGRTFIAWDLMKPWEVTAVAFLRDDDGEFTVWTPGHLFSWVWRGPIHIPKESAELLALWLTQRENSVVTTNMPRMGAHTEVSGKTIWTWDPNPDREVGIGILRLDKGGFELSLMMAGLRRGGAHIGSEDGDMLAQWLIADSGT